LKAKPFYFKQFTIHQDRCALKVGTDGVLLGAWTACKNSNLILDIGAGTGIISLMLSQRSGATITAIEIDKDASEQCADNFKNSPWSNRLTVIQQSVQKYSEKSTHSFDLIVSNPPFHSIQKTTTQRSTARSEQELNLSELFKAVHSLLLRKGKFCIIFPFSRIEELVQFAKGFQLYAAKICSVKGNHSSEVKRILVEFKFGEQQLIETNLTIEKERHNYTSEYRELCTDYLTIF
jgi:tRNA1Val (adenine37-N6)-methyltransferase